MTKHQSNFTLIVLIFDRQEEAQAGSYYLGQLCVNISNKLLFLSTEDCYADMKYNIREVSPKISVEIADDKTLIAGIPSTVILCIELGTYLLNEVKRKPPRFKGCLHASFFFTLVQIQLLGRRITFAHIERLENWFAG